MEGSAAVWVIASIETAVRVGDILKEARLLNPLRLIHNAEELFLALHPGCPRPRLTIVEIGLPGELSWLTLQRFSDLDFQSTIIALVSSSEESMLDRAYELGVKTYLPKDFSFSDLLERARLFGLQFVLGPAAREPL